jgi:hypothetical protein
MNELQKSTNVSPPELTGISAGPTVPDSQSTNLNKQIAEHSLDHVDRLAPEGFPNGPQGWAKVLPATLPNVNHVLN